MNDESGADPLEKILKFAGRRGPVDRVRAARVECVVHRHWLELFARRRLARRRRRVAWTGVGIAAAAAAVAAIAWLPRTGIQTPEIATVVNVLGAPSGGARGYPLEALARGADVRAGSILETHDGEGAALALRGGQGLRLAANTRVRLEADSVIVDSGAVYVDSGPAGSATAIDVRSALATVREHGTQYMVRVAAKALDVSVREGSVSVSSGRRVEIAHAGELLQVSVTGKLRRMPIRPYGERWDWVVDAAPTPALEGLALADFLEWLARERGWRLEYESPEAAQRAAAVELHGSIDGLSGEDALAVVMTSTGWHYRLAEGRLRVRAR